MFSYERSSSTKPGEMTRCEVRSSGCGGGRGCFAKEPIKKNEELFRELPFAWVIAHDARKKFCGASLKPTVEGEKMQRCSKCKWKYFKSRSDMQAMWNKGLKQDCKARRNWDKPRPVLDRFKESMQLPDGVVADNVQLIAQVQWAMDREGEAGKKLIDDLHDHWDDYTEEIQELYAYLAMAVVAFIDFDEVPLPSIPSVARLAGKLAVYAVDITTPGPVFYRIGTGLYPRVAGKVNHSNTPNCIFAFREYGELTALALRDIAADEEITVAYTPWENSDIAHVMDCGERYCFDLDGMLHLERPVLTSFNVHGLSFQVRKLHARDVGRDLQVWERTFGRGVRVDIFIRGNIGERYTLDQLRDLATSLVTNKPTKVVPAHHPVNLRILLRNNKSPPELLPHIEQAPERRIRDFATFYKASVLLEGGTSTSIDAAQVTNELLPYYLACGELGLTVLERLRMLIPNS